MPIILMDSDVLITILQPIEEVIQLISVTEALANVFKDSPEVRPVIMPVKILLDSFS